MIAFQAKHANDWRKTRPQGGQGRFVTFQHKHS